jgi:hypothetical protein
MQRELSGAGKEQDQSRGAEYNIVLPGFIELTNRRCAIGEPVCN